MKSYIFGFGFLIKSTLVLENEVKALYVIEIGNITFIFHSDNRK